ncbi:MAG: DNA gyrase subunit A [Bacillota bacterium]
MTPEEEVTSVSIEEKMQNSYLNYSLSVIIGRALPDVRDGLKPVHRRILYATKKLGLTPNKPHKKSARIVGEVLGKYHPHGDRAVYDAMVRMAQDFSQRYKLIDGHGNFGSIDGDSAAAMRYTEARLASISEKLLEDIEEETVEFVDNFDGSLEEPTVLPAKIPNLLVNGSSGIAVGMSTNIPPHNLSEVIEGLISLLANPKLSISELREIIPGPDFPTGGQIIGDSGIKQSYQSGKGKITLRGKSKIEDRGRGRKRLIITEIPYQLNKSKLIEEIAKAVKKEKISHVSDVRDESDKKGLRVVIDLKKKANPDIILNRLYKYTSLQSNVRINMLALNNQKPEVMNLKTILNHFLEFRKEIITRRTNYKLEQAQNKKHVLVGLKKAIDNLDLVISIIRNSESTKKAKKNLRRKLEVTKEQASAILNMRLQRLVSLEIEKLETDLAEIREKIKYFKSILKDNQVLNQILKDELLAVKEDYGDTRKTEIIKDDSKADLEKSDLIKHEDVVISFSQRKYIKRTDSIDNIRESKNDFITKILSGTTHDKLLFITNTGQSHILKNHKIPAHHGLSTGDPLNKFLKLPLNEQLVDIILLNDNIKDKYITIATKKGLVKKTKGAEYESTVSTIKAINLNDDDEIVDITITDGQQNLFLATKEGYTIHFDEQEVSPTGRNTKGRKSISLEKGDEVISINKTAPDNLVLALTDSGRGKASPIEEYETQHRNGKGLKTMSNLDYQLLTVQVVKPQDEIVCLTTKDNIIRKKVQEMTTTNRLGGMYLQFELKEEEKITRIIKSALTNKKE